MRLFLRLPLDAATTHALNQSSTTLRRAYPTLRWSVPQDWHVTLEFLGTTTPLQLTHLHSALAAISHPPPTLEITGYGTFPGGIFFAAIRRMPELDSLQQAIAAASGRSGFTPDPRPFHPHITLARIGRNRRADFDSLQAAAAASSPLQLHFQPNAFVLYETVPRPPEAPPCRHYIPRATFPLLPTP